MKLMIGDIEPSTGWGACWLDADDSGCFPERGWTDNALAVVSALLSELRRLKQTQTRSFEWFFFDGPYHVRFERAAGGRLLATGIEARSADIVRFEADVDAGELCRQAHAAIHRIDAAVDRRFARPDVVQALERALRAAEQMFD